MFRGYVDNDCAARSAVEASAARNFEPELNSNVQFGMVVSDSDSVVSGYSQIGESSSRTGLSRAFGSSPE